MILMLLLKMEKQMVFLELVEKTGIIVKTVYTLENSKWNQR